MIKRLLFALLFPVALLAQCTGSSPTWTCPIASTPAQVQTTINAASDGDTINIGAGTTTWTSGVTISGKTLNIQGAGAGRIIAYSSSTLTLGTGSKTLTILGTSVHNTPPTNIAPTITPGQTLHIAETGTRTNTMDGTVTSFNSGTGVLVMNITASNGVCVIQGGSGGQTPKNCKRWMISTIPQTTIVNAAAVPLFTITESTTGHTTFSGIKIGYSASGTGASTFTWNGTSGGQILIAHDIWVEQVNQCASQCNTFQMNTNRGLVYNSSFDNSPGPSSSGAGSVQQVFHWQPFDETSWATTSFYGTLDTGGTHNFYAESNDYHAYLNIGDCAEGSRDVMRYSVMDNAGTGSHGVDTDALGCRYIEYYNNIGVFEGYADGSTFNTNWWIFMRGGGLVMHDNVLPAMTSTDYGSKGDVDFIVENLNRNAGPNPCWGYNFTGGAKYYAPRQNGMGNVTGTGHDGLGRSTYNGTGSGGGASEYVGDPEPDYIWNNNRSPLNISPTNYSGPANVCTGGTPDTTQNYVVLNRDYFNGSTAKPGYTPFTYPHPLASSAAPIATFCSASMNLGQVPAGFSGNPVACSLTNTGTANLVAGTISITNSLFSLTSNTCGSPSTVTSASPGTGFTLTPGQSCTFNVVFAPGTLSLGQLNAGAQFFSNTSTSPDTIALSGTATGPPAPTNVMFAGEFKTSSGCIPATGKTMLCFADDCNCWLVSMAGATFRKLLVTGALQ